LLPPVKLRTSLQIFLSILMKTNASKPKAIFMKMTVRLFENKISSIVPWPNVLGDIINIRFNNVVIKSMIRVTDVIAESRKTILVKRRSAFLASVWLPVRSPCLSITCLNLKTETIFIHKSVIKGITISIRKARKKYSLK